MNTPRIEADQMLEPKSGCVGGSVPISENLWRSSQATVFDNARFVMALLKT